MSLSSETLSDVHGVVINNAQLMCYVIWIWKYVVDAQRICNPEYEQQIVCCVHKYVGKYKPKCDKLICIYVACVILRIVSCPI
jgi:hypothetical protein